MVLGDKDNLAIRALLNVWIGKTVLFFNIGKTMTEPQLTETVSLAVKHYGHFKPEDFKLCLEEAIKGNYGQLYDRIDGQVILGWFKAYDADRDYIAAEIASNANEAYKMADRRLLTPDATISEDPAADEVFKTNMAKLKAIMESNKITREKNKAAEPVNRPKNALYELSQRWLQQFDDLHFLRPVKVKSMRFVKRYGRTMDINEYLEYKHWQWRTFSSPVLKNDYRQKNNDKRKI